MESTDVPSMEHVPFNPCENSISPVSASLSAKNSSPESSNHAFPFVRVQAGSSPRQAACPRSARSQVMRLSIRRRRLSDIRKNDHFRVMTPEKMQRSKATQSSSNAASKSPSDHDPMSIVAPDVPDPFNVIQGDTRELFRLMRHKSARQAGEPVVSFDISDALRNMRNVFGTNLSDPAVCNAMLLSLSCAVEQDPMHSKVLGYKGETIRWISTRMSSPKEAASAGTIGTILLLISAEVMAENREAVTAHLNGVYEVLKLCDRFQVVLHDGIRRSTFWQDLISAILTGSERVLSHDVFPEMSWKRDPFKSSMFYLPRGFYRYKQIMNKNFVIILEDLKALQIMRDSTDLASQDPISIMHLDNHQASIESRLHDQITGFSRSGDLILECTSIAAFLSTFLLFTEVWDSMLVPTHLASRLLKKLQLDCTDGSWVQHQYLFVWIVCIGGICTGQESLQCSFAYLLLQQQELDTNLYSEECILEVLKSFIWSTSAYSKRWQVFWKRLSCPLPSHAIA